MDKFVFKALQTTTCRRHKCDIGEPCFRIFSINGKKITAGICNRRATAAGYFGRISPHALKVKR